jgi:aryl-alcohol dehydrogenase-like predicted oxidoreductase
MQTRNLNGLTTSAIGFGAMVLVDGMYGHVDEARSPATLHHAIDAGATLIDTADAYAAGANEQLVGKAIAGRRDEVQLATKFGNERRADGTRVGINGRPEYVRAACDASLERLGVDHIDLYYQHRVDKTVPIEDTVGAMKELVEAGKVRHLGLSEASPETIRRGHAVHPISALQTEWSLWTRDVADAVLPTVRALGIGYVAYSPLGRGFLSGRLRSPADFGEGDSRRHSPQFQGANFQKNLELLERVQAIADEKRVTPAQLALAWVMAQGDDVVPLPGTTKVQNLEENVAAMDIQLTDDDLERLDTAAPKGAVAGDRYPDMSTVDT